MNENKANEILGDIIKASKPFSKMITEAEKELFRKAVLEDIFMKRMGYKNSNYTVNKNEIIIENKIKIKVVTEEQIDKEAHAFFKGLNVNSVKWGILINARGIYLLCIDKLIMSETDTFKEGNIIFRIIYNKQRDQKYFSYFSYNNILGEDPNAYFFRDIIEYKNTEYKGKENSWTAYHSSLKRFLNFCIKERGLAYRDEKVNLYREIKLTYFKAYIEKETGAQTEKTIKSAFFYLKDFMIMMGNDAFRVSSNVILNLFPNVSAQNEREDIMDIPKLKVAFQTLKKGRNGSRNAALLLMLLSFGIERRNLCLLEWKKHILFNEKSIKIGDKIHKMPTKLVEALLELKKEGKSEKYVFYNSEKRNNEPIREGTITEILSKLAEINLQDEFYRKLTPANIRYSLVGFLLKQGVPLQEIMYLVDISISNISSYISDKDITEVCIGIAGNSVNNFLEQL